MLTLRAGLSWTLRAGLQQAKGLSASKSRIGPGLAVEEDVEEASSSSSTSNCSLTQGALLPQLLHCRREALFGSPQAPHSHGCAAGSSRIGVIAPVAASCAGLLLATTVPTGSLLAASSLPCTRPGSASTSRLAGFAAFVRSPCSAYLRSVLAATSRFCKTSSRSARQIPRKDWGTASPSEPGLSGTLLAGLTLGSLVQSTTRRCPTAALLLPGLGDPTLSTTRA
mmetsp:Transcript_39191/g.75109  ORF Transcript_39191/g.75109 Transcript_39191/m.75109 type:complete len:225 (-) Transcript_39191:142-816(-)